MIKISLEDEMLRSFICVLWLRSEVEEFVGEGGYFLDFFFEVAGGFGVCVERFAVGEGGADDVAVVVDDAVECVVVNDAFFAKADFAQTGKQFVELRMVGAVAKLYV